MYIYGPSPKSSIVISSKPNAKYEFHVDVILFVGFEVFTVVLMKSIIFWDMTACSPLSFNRRFGGTYRLHLQGRKVNSAKAASRLKFNGLHGVISKKMILFVILFIYIMPKKFP
jgi:hypothetical protein